MATGLRPWIISLSIVVLGAFFIMAFAFNFVYQTNPSSEIFNEKYGLNTSMTKMQENVNSFSDIATSVKKELGSSKPSAADYLFLIFQGAFYIPLTFLQFAFNGIGMLMNVIFRTIGGTTGEVAGWNPSLGIIAIVTGFVGAGLLVTIVFLIIKAIRTGESER